MKRLCYGWLVGLHPREFRERFGGEMMAIFDEAGGAAWLLLDALVSLVRQRVIRGELWRIAPIAALTLTPWILLGWMLAPAAYPPALASRVTPLDVYLLAVVAAVPMAACTTVVALTWHRIRRPHRRRNA